MLLFLTLSLACDETHNLSLGFGDTGGSTATDDTGPAGTTGSTDQNPLIEEGIIYCTAGSNSSGDIFYVELTATDPQGPDTILAWGGLIASYDGGGNQLFEDTILVCDDRGWCTGTFRDGVYSSVICSSHDLYTYTAQVVDEDDNWSEAFQLLWSD